MQKALAQMRASLPFALRGIDADNGSEFVNLHLYRYCQREGIQFTRRRLTPPAGADVAGERASDLRSVDPAGPVDSDTPAAHKVLGGRTPRGAHRLHRHDGGSGNFSNVSTKDPKVTFLDNLTGPTRQMPGCLGWVVRLYSGP